MIMKLAYINPWTPPCVPVRNYHLTLDFDLPPKLAKIRICQTPPPPSLANVINGQPLTRFYIFYDVIFNKIDLFIDNNLFDFRGDMSYEFCIFSYSKPKLVWMKIIPWKCDQKETNWEICLSGQFNMLKWVHFTIHRSIYWREYILLFLVQYTKWSTHYYSLVNVLQYILLFLEL